MRWAGNLVPGDLVYTPNYRSGLQYGRAVLIGDRDVGLLRWNEAKGEWLKRPQRDFRDVEWIAHESEPGALDGFFKRIKQDRGQWQASPGRSRVKVDRATGEERWVEKRRRWGSPPGELTSSARPEVTPDDLERQPQIEAVDEDSGETILINTHPSSPGAVEGRLITFMYQGAVGPRTSRTVLCWRCWVKRDVYVHGFCFLRQALRTFRADRMFAAHDARTGEVFSAEDFFRTHAGLAKFSGKATTPTQHALNIGRRRHQGVLAAALGICVLVGLALWQLATSNPPQQRRESLDEARASLGAVRPDLEVSLAAENVRTLQVTSTNFTPQGADALMRAMSARVRELGFRSVVLTNGREQWRYEVEPEATH